MLPWHWRVIYWLTFFPLGVILFIILLLKGIALKLFGVPLGRISRKSSPNLSNKRPVRLLCLAYLNDNNASARYRLYKYTNYVSKNDIEFHIVPPTSLSIYRKLFLPWKLRGHYLYFIIVFFRRFWAIWCSPKFDAVFFQREIISEFFYDPPFFIFALRLLSRRIIYDVDDAVWMLPPQSVRAKSRTLNILARLRFYWNVYCSETSVVSSKYLLEYTRKINECVKVIPTLVDVANYPVREHKISEPIIIGWTGGPGNLSYLKLIERPLARLALKYPIRLRIICSKSISMNGIDVDFVCWNKETEAKEIGAIDIGVMPLPDNSYTQGKGGFKILQYMAAGLPLVASPVGVNSRLIDNNKNGFLAEDEQDWEAYLGVLIEDLSLRREMGRCAREFVSSYYDYSLWIRSFVEIITGVNGKAEEKSNAED